MLKLYYSGGSGKSDSVSYAAKSFGQFMSVSELFDGLNNLFPDLSALTVQNRKTEYRAIVLVNDSEDEVLSNLSVWINDPDSADSDETNDSLCEIQLGWVDLSIVNNCAMPKFPHSITDGYKAPLNVTFHSVLGEENALDLPNIEPGMALGLWIKRIIKQSALTAPSDDLLCEISEGTVTLPTLESQELMFDWQELQASV